jgi:hypothetical protein
VLGRASLLFEMCLASEKHPEVYGNAVERLARLLAI